MVQMDHRRANGATRRPLVRITRAGVERRSGRLLRCAGLPAAGEGGVTRRARPGSGGPDCVVLPNGRSTTTGQDAAGEWEPLGPDSPRTPPSVPSAGVTCTGTE